MSTLLTIPDGLNPWVVANVERLRASLSGETREEGGVLRWKSNGATVPPNVFKDAFVIPPEGQQAAYDAEIATFVAAYRANQTKEPSSEELLEARAAFGPGHVVVDVVSGRRFRT